MEEFNELILINVNLWRPDVINWSPEMLDEYLRQPVVNAGPHFWRKIALMESPPDSTP